MMHQFHYTGIISEHSEIKALEHAAIMGFEAWWVDACWYGNEINRSEINTTGQPTNWWSEQVGNWYVRRSDFPRGLRPISDRAHALGMKFIFWMEPERAQPDTEWARTHPELFLSHPEENYPDPKPWRNGLLLNLGDPRAVDLAFEKISSLIAEFNADIYR